LLRREGVEQVFCFPANKMIDAAGGGGHQADRGSARAQRHQHGRRLQPNLERRAHRRGAGSARTRRRARVRRRRPGLRGLGSVAAACRTATRGASSGCGPPSTPSRPSGPSRSGQRGLPPRRRRTSSCAARFQLMRSGRPGPVVVELPLDVAEEEFDDALFQYSPAVRYRSAADPRDVERAVALLLDAERPLIRAGHGVLWAGATAALVEFAELLNAPVATTYVGKKRLPEDQPLVDRLGRKRRSAPASGRSSRMRTPYSASAPASSPRSAPSSSRRARRFIQATNDPDDLAQQYPIACGLVGDARLVLQQLTEELRGPAEVAQARQRGPRRAGRCRRGRRADRGGMGAAFRLSRGADQSAAGAR